VSETKKKTKLPLYLQLREVVRAKIESGEFPPGCAIPSENSLAEQYGIDIPAAQLDVRAEAHAIRNGGRSPRVAKQFIELTKSGI
jgi:DNA-binding transcriptional MocR family regulator